MKKIYSLDASLREIPQIENSEYPVNVYYVDIQKMYMGSVHWHWHEEVEISIINSGLAHLQIGDTVTTLSPGQGFFINQSTVHTISADEKKGCTYFSILFLPSFLFGFSQNTMERKYLQPLLDSSDIKFLVLDEQEYWQEEIINLSNDIIASNLSKRYGYELHTKSLLCNLWLALLKRIPRGKDHPLTMSLSSDDTRIKQALLFVETHYAEPLTLTEIADNLHISKSECCRCFKRSLGLTPFEYLMRYRISESVRKIQQKDALADSIATLALSVGFNNTSYYNKLFKKYMHCTPSSYKRHAKEQCYQDLGDFGFPLPSLK